MTDGVHFASELHHYLVALVYAQKHFVFLAEEGDLAHGKTLDLGFEEDDFLLASCDLFFFGFDEVDCVLVVEVHLMVHLLQFSVFYIVLSL